MGGSSQHVNYVLVINSREAFKAKEHALRWALASDGLAVAAPAPAGDVLFLGDNQPVVGYAADAARLRAGDSDDGESGGG